MNADAMNANGTTVAKSFSMIHSRIVHQLAPSFGVAFQKPEASSWCPRYFIKSEGKAFHLLSIATMR